MAFETISWAMTKDHLGSTTQLVLLKLANFRNQRTGQCNPSQKTLARACNKSVSTINVHLRLLEDQGLIRRIAQRDTSSGATRPSQVEFPLAQTSPGLASSERAAPPLRPPGAGVSSPHQAAPVICRRQSRK